MKVALLISVLVFISLPAFAQIGVQVKPGVYSYPGGMAVETKPGITFFGNGGMAAQITPGITSFGMPSSDPYSELDNRIVQEGMAARQRMSEDDARSQRSTQDVLDSFKSRR